MYPNPVRKAPLMHNFSGPIRSEKLPATGLMTNVANAAAPRAKPASQAFNSRPLIIMIGKINK